MKNTRAILAAALLTGLPVAAYSQGTTAPADAFLYIIWPPDGATLKGAFWCRFGLRNMGVTQAGSNRPNSGHHHLLIDADEPLDLNEPTRLIHPSFRRRSQSRLNEWRGCDFRMAHHDISLRCAIWSLS